MVSKYEIAFEEEKKKKLSNVAVSQLDVEEQAVPEIPDQSEDGQEIVTSSQTDTATKQEIPQAEETVGTTYEPKHGQQIVTPQENLAQKKEIAAAEGTQKSKYQVAYEVENKTAEDTMSAWAKIGEMITGKERSTAESILLPEVLDPGALKVAGGIGNNLKVATGLFLSNDTKGQIMVIKKYAPETQFRRDAKGNVIGNYKGQEFVLNKPGFSVADAQRTIIDMAVFFPAAKFVQIGKGLLAGFGIGGGVVSTGMLAGASTLATERGLEASREALGGEKKEGVFTGSSLQAAGLAIAAEIPVPVAGALLRRAKPFAEKVATKLGAKGLAQKIAKTGVIIDEDILKNLKEAEEASLEAGIDFLPTQATGIKADDILQRVLTEQPASSKIMMKFLDKQDQQSRNAVYNFLVKIAPTSSLIEGPAKFKKAAGKAIDKLKTVRRNETESLYRDVLKDPPDVSVENILSFIDEISEDFSKGGPVRQALNKAKKSISGGETPKKIYLPGSNEAKYIYKDVSLRKLHNTQMEIRDMIDGVGDKAVSSTAKKHLVEIRKMLLDTMENGSAGGSPAYKEVRDKFRELSQPIEELQNSLVGRASNLKDPDLRRMSSIIFNPAESNVETVKNIKNVIDSADPDAFPMLLRSSIEEKIETISKRAKNSPNEFSVALFKNKRQRHMMLEVMAPEQRKNAIWLEKALDIAAIGRGLGSDTASKTQILKKLSGTVASPIIGIIAPAATLGSVGAALSGARLLSSALRQKTLDRRARVLADIIVNEKWSQDMARIRKLGMETPSAMRQLAQLLNNASSDLDKKELDELQVQRGLGVSAQDAKYNYSRAGY
jgi:hypothetical protein